MKSKFELEHFEVLPKHVGVIMDGNGRWAKNRGLERSEGHKAGANVFRTICEYACDLGIECITFYAFSTENWARPEMEIKGIMSLLRSYLLEALDRKKENEEKGMRIKFVGDVSRVDKDLQKMIKIIEKQSAGKTRTVVNIAVNYGGKQEILRSVKEIAKGIERGNLSADDVTEELIEKNLYTPDFPSCDLIIRPSGEYRLSNFLTWQSAYSEFWFSDILWPDFTVENFNEALRAYEKRNRRFGGI
ncbi:MAG: di-trans,poly-cis-decaprenylcistransferase [Ruminococcaceae bacterium]|nr:di-trans,poly-cis-decaprenylcistransferase [Oscillospiraceae bacterium]